MLIAKRDRLALDVAVAALIKRSVKTAGARVVTADGIGNGEGPADHLVRTVIDGAAAYERVVIKGRTKAAQVAKARRSERIGQIPYCFRLKVEGPRNDRGFPIQLELDTQEPARLLLCSDGLYNELNDDAMARLCGAGAPVEAAAALIAATLETEARDNVTAVVCATARSSAPSA